MMLRKATAFLRHLPSPTYSVTFPYQQQVPSPASPPAYSSSDASSPYSVLSQICDPPTIKKQFDSPIFVAHAHPFPLKLTSHRLNSRPNQLTFPLLIPLLKRSFPTPSPFLTWVMNLGLSMRGGACPRQWWSTVQAAGKSPKSGWGRWA